MELEGYEEKHYCKHSSMTRNCLPGYRMQAA
jgi:hypothetical protein